MTSHMGEKGGSGQPEVREYDAVVEALRRALCKLQRYSFMLDGSGGVRRVPDRSGRWIDFTDAHELFDTEVVDFLLSKEQASAVIAKATGEQA